MRPPRPLTDRLALLFGQWFGTGKSRLAPGTVGSLGALPLVALLHLGPLWLHVLLTGFVCFAGVSISQRCSELLGEKDPSSVVIDEVAGVLIAAGFVLHGPLWAIALSWVLFRVFDITKPSVVDRVQHLKPAGLGIMADDILAGLLAGALSALGVWAEATWFG